LLNSYLKTENLHTSYKLFIFSNYNYSYKKKTTTNFAINYTEMIEKEKKINDSAIVKLHEMDQFETDFGY
jgi:hypothetical protein